MQWYCGSCWSPVAAARETCPRCGSDPSQFFDRASYVEKLLRALEHPDAQTVRRAVWLLGELRVADAVEPFGALLDREPDLYLTFAILDAARQLGGAGRAIVDRLSMHPSAIVREHAQKARSEVVSW